VSRLPRPRFAAGVACALALAFAPPPASASAAPATAARADGQGASAPREALPRHLLEERALSAPDEVLKALPARIAAAGAAGDSRELALLQLARANACRVVADWPCQREAGAQAGIAARAAGQPILRVRGLIAESRALIAMQDFSRGEERLAEAEVLLKSSPSPELAADVFLAYSSLSWALGKQASSAEYASRGLAVLPPDLALPTQTRLLRNLARAQAQLGQAAAAQATLARAGELSARIRDPKLSAEILLGAARLARLSGDQEAQRRSGEQVLALARQLKNSQLTGMGHEVLGLAALEAGDGRGASRELRLAYESFRALDQKRDELRVLRDLIRVSIEQGQDRATVDAMVRRFLDIDTEIERSDRAKAADDFDARLEYAERELDVLRLKDEAVLAAERERALSARNRLAQGAVVFALLLLVLLGAFYLAQRRSNARLKATLALLRESEARAHDLLNLSAGFVFLHDVQGRLMLVNPATAQALGQPAEILVGRSLQDFQPRSGREGFADYLERLLRQGHDEGVFLVRSGEGDHRHWRYSSRLSTPEDGRAYAIGNAVDVTDQVEEARELQERSLRDALTGAYNRRQLEIFALAQGARGWGAITVDLDNFKQVNDTQGHDRGDAVLVEFARFLHGHLRGDDVVVRLGGDEFVVLLAGADAETLKAAVARLRGDAANAPCGFSIGEALRESGEALVATIARADAHMYAARAARRADRAAPASPA
jgi:diguanylate cyclase (GGDEF)-like protein/PAS domain S-box-containing protein